jgi:hypothetical protein
MGMIELARSDRDSVGMIIPVGMVNSWYIMQMVNPGVGMGGQFSLG